MATDYAKLTISAAASDFVQFKFKEAGSNVVTVLKSFLSSKSTVFANQINNARDGNTVDIDHDVHFAEYKQFNLLIEVLIGSTCINSINLYNAACLYFYAEKYQINDLKNKLTSALPRLHEPTGVIDLKLALLLVKEYGLESMIPAIDHIKLSLEEENCLSLY